MAQALSVADQQVRTDLPVNRLGGMVVSLRHRRPWSKSHRMPGSGICAGTGWPPQGEAWGAALHTSDSDSDAELIPPRAFPHPLIFLRYLRHHEHRRSRANHGARSNRHEQWHGRFTPEAMSEKPIAAVIEHGHSNDRGSSEGRPDDDPPGRPPSASHINAAGDVSHRRRRGANQDYAQRKLHIAARGRTALGNTMQRPQAAHGVTCIICFRASLRAKPVAPAQSPWRRGRPPGS